MNDVVVTTLVVDSDEKGAIDYARAMTAAQSAAREATAANDNYARSLRSANDNARDAADQSERSTLGLRQVAQGALQAAEAYAKKAAAIAIVVTVLGSLAAIIFPIIAVYKALKTAIDLVTEAWDLGGKKLAEYVELLRKADSQGVTTDFFQRISKGADAAKFSTDDLSRALDRLKQSSGERLGGSEASQRLDALTGAGNFGSNSGVGELKGANSAEERIRAFASLFDQAVKAGERLAALDLSRTMFGAEVADRLAKDSGFLKDMLASADKIKDEDLISAGDISRAKELQDRLDAAEKILSQRWHPIQDALTSLGIKMRESWVGMVEAAASAFDWASRLAEKLASIPSGFWTLAARGASGALSAFGPVGALFSGAATAVSLVAGSGGDSATSQAAAGAQMADARRRLATALNARFDVSGDPNKPKIEAETAAFDRAEEALRKYAETTSAAAATIDQTTAAQERARAMAQLTAAAMKDGLSREAAVAKAQLSGLADAASLAADKLARARVNSSINFGLSTGFLSQGDVSIAQQLKGLYPDVASALGSVEAKGLRAAATFREIGSAIENSLATGLNDILTGAKSVSQGFTDMGLAIVKAIDQAIIKILIVEPLMRSLQASISGSGIFGFLGIGGGGGAAVNSAKDFAAGGFHSGGIIGGVPTFSRMISSAYFSGAPRFHGGGIAGDEVPIIARRGEGVFTPAQMAAMGGAGNVTVNVTNAPADTSANVSTRRGSNGDLQIDVMLDSLVARKMVTPGSASNRVLTDQLGGAQQIASR